METSCGNYINFSVDRDYEVEIVPENAVLYFNEDDLIDMLAAIRHKKRMDAD